MDETYVGSSQRRTSHDSGGRGNLIHDGYGTREYTTVSGIHRNDGNPGGIASTRCVDKEYRLRAIALSAGLFFSGIVFTVIQIIR